MQTVTTSFTEHIENRTKTRFRTDLEKTDKTEREKQKQSPEHIQNEGEHDRHPC